MKVIGRVKHHPLSKVQPNDWNPNRMTKRQFVSLKHGLEVDGWLASQALLVWDTDDQGAKRNIIIDGEHRWKAAGELGFTEAPMVLIKGLSEPEAQALTIKLDAKRGEFDQDSLGGLVRELSGLLETPDLALDLGFEAADYSALIAEPESVGSSSSAGVKSKVVSENTHTKMTPLYMTADAHNQFLEDLEVLSCRYNTETFSDTIIAAIDEVL